MYEGRLRRQLAQCQVAAGSRSDCLHLVGPAAAQCWMRTPIAAVRTPPAALRLCGQLMPMLARSPHSDARADVLSDASARALYDELGPDRMRSAAGAAAGAGNARAAWDEFKPFRRENKRTRARAVAASASEAGAAGGAAGAGPGAGGPAFGDVVEYPLRAVEVAELGDGRRAGVGLLVRALLRLDKGSSAADTALCRDAGWAHVECAFEVRACLPVGGAVCPLKPCKPQVGRNCDRGDAAKLPPEQLDMCEIEPMRLEEPGSNRCMSPPPTLCRSLGAPCKLHASVSEMSEGAVVKLGSCTLRNRRCVSCAHPLAAHPFCSVCSVCTASQGRRQPMPQPCCCTSQLPTP